jgi:tetratricopeptide (TPR) repeat protein
MGLTGARFGRRRPSLSSALTLAALLAAVLPAHAEPPPGSAKPAAAGPSAPAGTPEVQAAVQLFEKGKTADAKAALEAILKREPKNGPAAFQLGRIAYAAQDSETAIARFGLAVETAPDSSLYHMWLGRAHAQKAIKASNIKRAFIAPSIKKEFERAVALDPKHIDARFDLARFYVLAPGIMGGSVEKAKAQAAEVRKLDALQGHQCFAMIYEEQKQYDLVEKEYLAAVKEYPDDRRPAFWLGLHYQNRGKYAEAFEIFEKRAKLDPPDRGALYQIGKTAILSGQRLDRGEECLRLYLQGQPGAGEPPLAWAHFRLGMLLEKKGDALRLQPDHEDAKKALAKLG